MNNKLKVSLMLASVLMTVKGYSITINSIEIKNSKDIGILLNDYTYIMLG